MAILLIPWKYASMVGLELNHSIHPAKHMSLDPRETISEYSIIRNPENPLFLFLFFLVSTAQGKGNREKRYWQENFPGVICADFKVFLFPGSCEPLRVAFTASIASKAVFGLHP